jgi:hypothetical protein
MWEKADKIAQGAALMTDTTVSSRVFGSAWPIHSKKVLAETHYANIKAVGLPTWTEADITLAKAVQRELKVPEVGLVTEIPQLRGREAIPDEEKRGGGSDDIGDISLERADRHAELSSQLPGGAGAQLGERDRDGDAHRAPGRRRGGQGTGDDRPRRADATRDRDAGVGLFPQRLDEERTIRATHPPAGHWQIVYYQKTPLRLPKGTELQLTGHWDNSPANKWNPDPTAAVRWGDQSWQEMLSAPMGIIVDRNVDPKTVVERGGFPGGVEVQ